MSSFSFQDIIYLLSLGLQEPPWLFTAIPLHAASVPAVLPSRSPLNVSTSLLTAGLCLGCSISLRCFLHNFRSHFISSFRSLLKYHFFRDSFSGYNFSTSFVTTLLCFIFYYTTYHHLAYHIFPCLLFVFSLLEYYLQRVWILCLLLYFQILEESLICSGQSVFDEGMNDLVNELSWQVCRPEQNLWLSYMMDIIYALDAEDLVPLGWVMRIEK